MKSCEILEEMRKGVEIIGSREEVIFIVYLQVPTAHFPERHVDPVPFIRDIGPDNTLEICVPLDI